jgi:hypothetical protein
VIFSLFDWIIRSFSRINIKTGTFIGLPIGIILFASMWYGVFVTRYNIKVNHIEFVSDKIPSSFNGYKIVQFSDAHVGTWGNDTTFISRLTDSINAQNGNLIVFTGDIVNRNTQELLPFVDIFSRLNAPDGVYSILGNHDYGLYQDWKSEKDRETNNCLLAELESKMGWKLLKNEHLFLHNNTDSIALIGVENWGEPPFGQLGDIDKAFSGTKNLTANDNHFKILLTHNPEHWNREVRKKTNIDLSLSGHTHAMQVAIGSGKHMISPAAWKYKQWGGMYTDSTSGNYISRLYVNIGAGEVGMPARIGSALPEITVITLRKE